MGQLLDKKWITQEYYDSQTFPTPVPLASVQQNALEGVRAHIQAQVAGSAACSIRITMVISAQDELKYNALCHILALVRVGGPREFQREYKRFFCEADDKSYVQDVKLRILREITTPESFDDVFNELT